jgi:hypothetical protein
MFRIALALAFFITAYLAPASEADPKRLRQRQISPPIAKSMHRLSRPSRVPRIRRLAPAREPRSLDARETEQLRKTEEFIRSQSFPGSICRGC